MPTFRPPGMERISVFTNPKKAKAILCTTPLKNVLLIFRIYQLERKIVAPKMVPDWFYYLVKSYGMKIFGYKTP